MRTYIYSVVCMAALGGAVLIVTPEGVRSGLKKHIRLICSLCLLCVMISPISQVLDGLKNIGEMIKSPDEEQSLHGVYESMYEEMSESGYSESLGEAVKKELDVSFSIPSDDVRTTVEFSDADGDGFREPIKITVLLSGLSILKDPRKIEQLISEKFDCECVCAAD